MSTEEANVLHIYLFLYSQQIILKACWIKLHINSPVPLKYLFDSGKWNTFPEKRVDAGFFKRERLFSK